MLAAVVVNNESLLSSQLTLAVVLLDINWIKEQRTTGHYF